MDAAQVALPLRVAIVTGASSGLGREFARQLDALQVADQFWLIARKKADLETVAAELKTPCELVEADLTVASDVAAIARRLEEVKPDVRFLVNAAGFGKFGDWQTIPEGAVDAMIDLNCRGLVDMTRNTLPYMGKGSGLVQIASSAGFVPLPHMNVYAATKAFVLRYTRALRWELRGRGISVTALCPTWVKTGFEKVARQSNGGHDVRHLLGAQKASTVVRRALRGNHLHAAVVTGSVQGFLLRILGKVVPDCVIMAGWEGLRRL